MAEAHADTPWRLATAPGVERYFELPTISVVDISDRQLLVAGRTDLLVRDPATRTWTVIDFKAGTHFPSSTSDLVTGASLSTYGPQLEGYAAALNVAFANSPWAGERVTRCILWFVRAGASVTWAPVGLSQASAPPRGDNITLDDEDHAILDDIWKSIREETAAAARRRSAS